MNMQAPTAHLTNPSGPSRRGDSLPGERGLPGWRELASTADDSAPFLESVLAQAPQAAIAVDAAGEVRLLNPAAERLLGVRAAEVSGGPAAQLLGLSSFPGPLSAALRGGAPVSEERSYSRGDGAALQILVEARPIEGAAGALRGACAWLTDLTETRAAQAKLLRSEAGFRAYLDHTPELVAVHRAGKIIYVNPAALAHLAYDSAGELLGRSPLDMMHPDDRALIFDRIQLMQQRGMSVPVIEERMLRKDGTWLPMEVAALPLVFEGEPSILVMGIDISARKRAEAERERALGEAQRRAAELECVLGSMVDAVFVCDARGRLTLANQSARTLLGSLPWPGWSISDLARAGDVRRLDGAPVLPTQLPLARALAGEVIRQEELRWKAEGRDLVLRTSAAPLRGESGEVIGAVEVARDVTEQVEVERLKDEFIRVSAHELKTPVAITKGYAQALLRCAAPLAEDEVRRQAEAINRGSDRIGRIVQGLLDISRLHLDLLQLNPERLDLAALAREAVQSRPARERGRIALEDAGEAPVVGDRRRLGQVLENLVDNALKYSSDSSPVEVKVRRRGAAAVVEVADRGIGIPAPRQAHIFERFYRAHTDTPDDRGGMGVGLFISREIVDRLGGTMGFESREGAGSTFWFELPLAR
jgi:PAS domain S-box-containing protein